MRFHPEYLKLAGAQALFFITVIAALIGFNNYAVKRSVKTV